MTFGRTFFLGIALTTLAACGGGGTESQSSSAPTGKAQAPVDPATVGTISGSVKFTGSKPKTQTISMGADAYCKGTHTTTVYTETVVINPNGTLKNVYVYVKAGAEGKSFAPPAQPALLDQKGCIYIPHVLSVQAGQDIVIQNSDGVLHNVNARPKNNRGFNIGQPVKGMKTTKKFDKAEVGIPLKCDVHPWMKSYISVQAHPFGSVTDGNGAFSLKNLPPGTYEVEAWHEKYGVSSQSVTVGAKETKSISFNFKGA